MHVEPRAAQFRIEMRLLAHLRARIARAKADLGAPDPLDDERRIARLVMEPEIRR